MQAQSPLTWGEQLAWGTTHLRESGSATPKLDASVLLAHVLDVPRTILLGFPERAITAESSERYREWIARRAAGEPVAYLTGHKEFMGLDLLVDARVLVPRPETELVVEAALSALVTRFGGAAESEEADATASPIPDVLAADIGTGSGAIAISLATLEHRIGRIYAVEVSAAAMAVAQHNADRLHVSDRISWLQGDLLAPVPAPVDLIVANLPYVRDEPGEAEENVVRFEPHLALFGADKDGLGHIRRLIAQVPAKLRAGGSLVLEFGYDQRAAIAALLAAHLPAAEVRFGTDYAGWDRFVVATLPV